MPYSLTRFETIVSSNSSGLDEFVCLGVDAFFKELLGYINHNNDMDILNYANEQTLSCLFVNGLIRRDGNQRNISAVQEYGTYRGLCNGRADVFIKHESNAIWIESKYDKYGIINKENHWDISSWMAWDESEILNQVNDYYNAEKKLVNDSYSTHYIMTLTFKKAMYDEVFFREGYLKLKSESFVSYNRPWYYSIAFFKDDEGCYDGMEVYGTFQRQWKKT